MRARKGRTRSAIGGQLCWCAGACVRVCVCGGGGSTTRIHPAGRPPPPTQPTYAPTHPPARPPTHHPPSHAVLCSSSTAAVQCSTTCLPLHGTGCPPPAGARAAPASRGGAPPLPPGAPPAPPDQQRMGGRGSSSVGRGRGGGGAARTTAHARLASTRPDTALAWRRCCSATSACARLRHSSCAARGRGGGGEKRVQAQGGARAPSPCPRTRLPTPLAPAPTPPPTPPSHVRVAVNLALGCVQLHLLLGGLGKQALRLHLQRLRLRMQHRGVSARGRAAAAAPARVPPAHPASRSLPSPPTLPQCVRACWRMRCSCSALAAISRCFSWACRGWAGGWAGRWVGAGWGVSGDRRVGGWLREAAKPVPVQRVTCRKAHPPPPPFPWALTCRACSRALIPPPPSIPLGAHLQGVLARLDLRHLCCSQWVGLVPGAGLHLVGGAWGGRVPVQGWEGA